MPVGPNHDSERSAPADAGAPLQGIRVIDASRILAGPLCGVILGDLGADVIKVEHPRGDETRRWGPPFLGSEAGYFVWANRNKRGVGLDLAEPEGRAVFRDLCAHTDVLLENFKLGTMERWGLGREDLSRLNPRLVHSRITGFGTRGPKRDWLAFDFVLQAMTGWMSITGRPDGEPTKVGVAIVDIFTALYSCIGVLASLQERDARGGARHVDTSLWEAGIASLANVAANWLLGGIEPRRFGNAHPNSVPYQTFPAADGPLALGVGSDGHYRVVCEILDRPDLASDPKFATNAGRQAHRDELIPLLQELFRTKTVAEWVELLQAHGVPAGPVNTVPQAFADSQTEAMDMILEMEHPELGPYRTTGSPLKLDPPPAVRSRPAPLLGEHTDEVLGEWLAYDRARLDELRASGALG